ncbi:MAG: T9SS type A sorting domain-containing protein [Bacteroidota bacterium]
MRVLFVLLALTLPLAATGQTCPEPPEAITYLEGNAVRAQLFNDGALFYAARSNGTETLYEVPAGSGKRSFYTTALWVLGEANGELRAATSVYGPQEFRPGPLGADGQPPTDCSAFDRIWRVSVEDIARYNATGEATPDLADWPAHLGAPVLEGDGDPDTYDLAAGDRPAILGAESAWWVMNDRAVEHVSSQTPPVGLEVRAMASAVSEDYAVGWLGTTPADGRYLHHATAYRYEITYRGEVTLEEAFFGLWVDIDLGFFSDNYYGSAADLGTAYVYNGDDFDEGPRGYGASPPATGVTVLEGPVSEKIHAMGALANTGTIDGLPSSGAAAYTYAQGLWQDGSPFTYGGFGMGGGPVTRYLFPDRPPGYWSEMDIDGEGTMRIPSNRRFFLFHGPFTLQPGETATFAFALPWARAETGALASLDLLLDEAVPAMDLHPSTPDPRLATVLPGTLPTAGESEPEASDLRLTIAPNPARGPASLHVRLDVPAAHARLAVYDLLGREVARIHDGPLAVGEQTLPLTTAGLAPGAYYLRLTTDVQQITRRFVLTR